MVSLKLGLWFQVIGVTSSTILFLGYALAMGIPLGGWEQGRGGITDLKIASQTVPLVQKIRVNRNFMLALLPFFILDEIYVHTTSLPNLNLTLFSIGEFFSLSFLPFFCFYFCLYFIHRRNPLRAATLYFAASAAEDNVRLSLRLAEDATSCLSKAVTKNTGVLRMKEDATLLANLFAYPQNRTANLLRLAQSCIDIRSALDAFAAATHANVESLLEYATLEKRILAAPWDLILGAMAIIIEVLFRVVA
jgi:hypothetical protein